MPAPDLGVFLPSMSETDATLGDVVAPARHAEALGFESVWVVDQLVAGTGVPFLDSGMVLAAAAPPTERVRLGYGVMILPLRPVTWAAKQVASLQHLSGDRVVLGIGVGGDRHDRSWVAAGVPVRERGRRTDAALRVLPELIAGRPVPLHALAATGSAAGVADLDLHEPAAGVQLAPGAPVPPLVIGGTSDAAVRRVVEHGDGWFLTPAPPAEVAAARARLEEAASAAGRPVPALTASIMPVLDGDPARPDDDALVARLVDPDGMFGMPPAAARGVLSTGSPADLAAELAAHRAAGALRVVATVGGGDWYRQVELLAEAGQLAG